jgi:hypothetical protein
MSSDDGIYILISPDQTGKKIHCAAYARAIGNFFWHINNGDTDNAIRYALFKWGDSKKCSTLDEAYEEAKTIALKHDYLEYGISIIETHLSFFNS